jgi:hypothetical protein
MLILNVRIESKESIISCSVLTFDDVESATAFKILSAIYILLVTDSSIYSSRFPSSASTRMVVKNRRKLFVGKLVPVPGFRW